MTLLIPEGKFNSIIYKFQDVTARNNHEKSVKYGRNCKPILYSTSITCIPHISLSAVAKGRDSQFHQ